LAVKDWEPKGKEGSMSEEKEVKEEKGEKSEKKEKKKKKKEKEVKQVHVTSSKANPQAKIVPTTGTRFDPGTARQLAFDIVLKMAKDGKNAKQIREVLAVTRKDNKEKPAKFSLDVGYLNFVVASHPEFFKVWTDGRVEILKEPKVDPEAAKKYEEEKANRKKKAEKAREKRRKQAEDKKEEKKEGKKEEKKEE
jgi:hypothetical protein